MNNKEPIFPKNWPEEYRTTKNWKSDEVQENICPDCGRYSTGFTCDEICQFCGYEIKPKEVSMDLDQLKVIEVCGQKIIKYNHHGNDVFVLKDDVGNHREHCLCWMCGKFYPEPEDMAKNCPIARLLYNICVTLKMVVPVWECPVMVPPRADQLDEKE